MRTYMYAPSQRVRLHLLPVQGGGHGGTSGCDAPTHNAGSEASADGDAGRESQRAGLDTARDRDPLSTVRMNLRKKRQTLAQHTDADTVLPVDPHRRPMTRPQRATDTGE